MPLRSHTAGTTPGSRVTAVACRGDAFACAVSAPTALPEVLLWTDSSDEPERATAADLHDVAALALASRDAAVAAGRGGAFVVARGTAKQLPIAYDEEPSCLACDETGQVIAAGVARAVDVATRDGVRVAKLEGHRGRVTGVAFRAGGGPFLASCAEDRSFRVWDLRRKTCA